MRKARVLIVSVFPPPYGGVSVMAEALASRLSQEDRITLRRMPVRIQGRFRPFKALMLVAFWLRLFPAVFWCDVLHIHATSFKAFFQVAAPSILLGCFFRRRVVVTYHGGGAEQFFRTRPWGRIALRILSLSDEITCPSEALSKAFQRRNINVRVIPNFADLPMTYSPKTEYARKNANRLICIAHIASEQDIYTKGVDILWMAMSLVRRKLFGVECRFVGNEIPMDRIYACVRRRYPGIEGDEIQFLGVLNHERAMMELAASDAIVLTSRWENCPVTLLEAMILGVPAVATDVGGNCEILSSDKLGIIVPADDPSAIALGIIRALKKQWNHSEISLEGKRRFSWDSVRSSMLDCYGIRRDTAG